MYYYKMCPIIPKRSTRSGASCGAFEGPRGVFYRLTSRLVKVRQFVALLGDNNPNVSQSWLFKGLFILVQTVTTRRRLFAVNGLRLCIY